jgi:hypothetical protein
VSCPGSVIKPAFGAGLAYSSFSAFFVVLQPARYKVASKDSKKTQVVFLVIIFSNYFQIECYFKLRLPINLDKSFDPRKTQKARTFQKAPITCSPKR